VRLSGLGVASSACRSPAGNLGPFRMRIVIFTLRPGWAPPCCATKANRQSCAEEPCHCFSFSPYISPCHITLILAASCCLPIVGAMTFADPESPSGRESEAARQVTAPASKDNNALSAAALLARHASYRRAAVAARTAAAEREDTKVQGRAAGNPEGHDHPGPRTYSRYGARRLGPRTAGGKEAAP
jgi:hypothetical protein